MAALALPLALQGPMMAFGTGTHEREKPTSTTPTKSAVLGLVAAALGRDYQDDQRDLHALRVHVRIDAPGVVQRDYQVIRNALRANGTVNAVPTPVLRDHVHDAAFLVVLEGDQDLVRAIERALRNPVFPVYLGLRACPPARPVYVSPATPRPALAVLQDVPDLTGHGGQRMVLLETPGGYLTRRDQPLPGRRFTTRRLRLHRVTTAVHADPQDQPT